MAARCTYRTIYRTIGSNAIMSVRIIDQVFRVHDIVSFSMKTIQKESYDNRVIPQKLM